MNVEFLMAAAETQEKLGKEASLRGDETMAKRKFSFAAQKYREAANAFPAQRVELLRKAAEMESLAAGVELGAPNKASASARKNTKDVASKAAANADAKQSVRRNEAKSFDENKLNQAIAKVNDLVGLHAVKRTISEWISKAKISEERRDAGYKVSDDFSHHMVFMGNPGTGKTTVARLMAEICLALGIVSQGQLVEVGRDDLVAGYVGQTAQKMAEAIEKARGGILFIDEAYSLAEGGSNDFGREAINTLVQKMENYRDDLVVIVAGYFTPMENFIATNAGLRSRFTTFVRFEDYNGQEMYSIFENTCRKSDYIYSDAVKCKLISLFNKIYNERDKSFANGRDVRNIFEMVETRQAVRLSQTPHTQEDLRVITEEDIPFNV